MRKFIPVFLLSVFVLGACSSWNKTATGTVAGAGAGAALGAVIGGLIGHDGKSAAIGAAIGTAVGGGAGALIGRKMDKKAEELAALNAKVETVTDANGLEAIKVTFDNGILFATNKATLSAQSQKELKEFAAKMADMPDTDVTVYGHTDNTGSAEVNEKLSTQRPAESLPAGSRPRASPTPCRWPTMPPRKDAPRTAGSRSMSLPMRR